MKNNFKIIFVHGWDASSHDHWYPNISKELNNLEVEYIIPDFPGGEYPHAADWIEKIRETVNYTNLPLVFVGHSLGTRAILLYLEKYNLKVEAVFLIAAFSNKTENATKYDKGEYSDFFEKKADLERIKKLSQKWVVVHSKDDLLNFDESEQMAKELNAKFISFEDRGHMSEPDNAPIILDILRKELDF